MPPTINDVDFLAIGDFHNLLVEVTLGVVDDVVGAVGLRNLSFCRCADGGEHSTNVKARESTRTCFDGFTER